MITAKTKCHFVKIFVLFFSTVQLFCNFPKCQADCKIYKPVANETKQETELLNKIKPLNGITFEVNDADYSYKITICDQVKGYGSDVGAIQSKGKTENHILGKYTTVDIMGGTDWILLTYYGGDKYTSHSHCNNGSERIATIMITCDPDNLKGKFEILEERKSSQVNCYYLFELNSNVSCTVKTPEEKPSKLSSGSVFCILFFTVIAVYLVCGFLYKRIVIGAKGLEQIPNYTFWRDFGNLQADGCDYLCRWGSRQEAQAYRGIDDHLKMDEERDDQLLNM